MAELKTLFKGVKGFADTLSRRGLATYAASCAFYAFLSLFPLAALAASLVPCVGVDEAALLRLIDSIAPAEVTEVLETILTNVYAHVFPALPLSILMLLWSAAQAFAELLKGMRAMTEPGQETSFLRRRLRAIFLTLALLLILLLSLSVLIFGTRIVLLLTILHPNMAGLLAILLRLRYLAMTALLWLLFLFLYRSIPGRGFTCRQARLGAALAAGAWMAFSALFSVYATRFFDLTLYGSMAALTLTMLWLFYCQYIVLVGAGLCGYLQNKTEAAREMTAS